MSYALKLLKEDLEDLESIQIHCLRCDNKEDSEILEERYGKDLKMKIRVLEIIEESGIIVTPEFI